MITLNVLINDKVVLTRSARNVGVVIAPHGEFHVYQVDDGTAISHKRSDGVAVLAAKMLAGVYNINEMMKKPPLWARIVCWFLDVKIW